MNRMYVSTAARVLGMLSLALSASLIAVPAGATIYNLQTNLAGAQEIPSNASGGSASISGVYNDETNVLLYSVTYRLDSVSTVLTAAHLHGPATTSQTAPPLVDLDFSRATGTNSFFNGSVVLDNTEEGYLKAARLYINLHSDQFPNGELRGQLSPQAATEIIASASANPSQETSTVTLNGATPEGFITAGFDPATRRLTVGTIYSGLTSNAAMAHLHGPAPAGQAAGVIFTYSNLPVATDGVVVQRFSLSVAQVTQLHNGELYFNLHTANNTGGEIRGQLVIGSQRVADTDGDGLSDEAELSLKTNRIVRDTDGDTIEDGVEYGSGTDPRGGNGASARTDSDRDLLPNAVDSSPNNPDSDNDGFLDGFEVASNTDPRSAASKPTMGDLNRDGRVDNVDAVVAVSQFIGSPFNGPYSAERGDLNRDGVNDNVDIVLIFNFFLGNIKTLPQAVTNKK